MEDYRFIGTAGSSEKLAERITPAQTTPLNRPCGGYRLPLTSTCRRHLKPRSGMRKGERGDKKRGEVETLTPRHPPAGAARCSYGLPAPQKPRQRVPAIGAAAV
ncbi:hypothetical protein SKAU_G00318640 [Synaphobranchus kaupii]|uniref:Uncharacterized protein n=1 Tax=Synaphobranchus kaupii TaxID=118154 RepID=A0A9Q1ET33_SYNKA|nr:hypothetical protein SKAU_G00318640 [Synaphobranchus kaupii]